MPGPGLIPIDLSDDLLADNRRLVERLRELEPDEPRPTGPDPRVAILEAERDQLKEQLKLEEGNSTRLRAAVEERDSLLEAARETIKDLESKAADREREFNEERSRWASELAQQKAKLEACERKLKAAQDAIEQFGKLERQVGALKFDLAEKEKEIENEKNKVRLLKQRK